MVLRKIYRLLNIINSEDAIKSFILLKRKFSISSFRINAVVSEYQPKFKTIIDVGSNIGQFALSAALRFPMARIYCFEPVPDVFRELEYNLKNLTDVEVTNCAIGDENGTIDFYRNDYTLASSAMKMVKENKHYNCDDERFKRISVKLAKLDDIFPFQIEKPVLLKLDVQGFEKLALQGAKNVLKQTDFIVIEMSFVRLYEDQPLFNEMHDFLKENGFELLVPADINEGENCEIVEMDVIYRRVE